RMLPRHVSGAASSRPSSTCRSPRQSDDTRTSRRIVHERGIKGGSLVTDRSTQVRLILSAADPINQSALDDSSASRQARAVLDRTPPEDRQPRPPRRRPRPRLRRYAWSLALTAAAAATALAVISQAAGNSASGPTPATSPAAWTVAKLAHSTVLVKGSDYMRPATLEHKLRAAGVLADVKTFTWNPAACGPIKPPGLSGPLEGWVSVAVRGRIPSG